MTSCSRRLVAGLFCCLAGLAFFASGGEASRRLRSPVISPGGGHYDVNVAIEINIRCEAGGRIVYTLDGTLPSETHGIHVDRNIVTVTLPAGDVTVHAVAIGSGYERSPVRTAAFTRSAMTPAR